MRLDPGSIIGRYTVEEMVGEGGMAAVYRVRHNELHATYALKVLNLVSEAIQRRLVQEGRVQARLRHPNILPVTDILDVSGRPGLIMEYIPGPSLELHLAKNNLTLDEVEPIAQGILSAVAFAHSQGVVHRDLKPANILLADYAGELIPKVADFGLVKVLGDDDSLHKTRSGIGIGTPCYMAPEQALDAAHVDARADVFSLGAILYELVCGRRAFHGPNTVAIILRIAAGQFIPPEQLRPELPQRMLNAIRGAMQTDRSQRIQDSQALRAIWSGKESWHAPVQGGPGTPEQPAPDATWSEEDLMASKDGGLVGLQDIIRSIVEPAAVGQVAPTLAAPEASNDQPRHQQGLGLAPTAAPLVSSNATAVPPDPIPPPPRLPTMDLGPLLDSMPDADADAEPGPDADSGTLADDAPLADATGRSSSEGEVSHSAHLLQERESASAPAVARRLVPEQPPPGPVPGRVAELPSSDEEQSRRGLGLLPKLMVAAGLLLALGVGGTLVASLVVFSESAQLEPKVLDEPDEPDVGMPTDPGVVGANGSSSEPAADLSQVIDEDGPTEALDVEPPHEPTDPEVVEPTPSPPSVSSAKHSTSAPPVPRTGTVEVSGDMLSAVLISSSGRRLAPGMVPVGTYDLEVGFENGKTVTRSDMVVVTAGGSVSIRCSSRVENCR